ncbi:hypothetical protein ACU6ZT_16280 [Klebsiella aerogenes]
MEQKKYDLTKYSDEELMHGFVMYAKELNQRSHGVLNSAQLLVYMNMYDGFLRYRANGGEKYQPSNASLAKNSGCTKKTVAACQEHLEKLGLITATFKKQGCKTEWVVKSWLECDEIMAGTLDSEDRDIYLEERKEKAFTNHKKAKTEEKAKEPETEVDFSKRETKYIPSLEALKEYVANHTDANLSDVNVTNHLFDTYKKRKADGGFYTHKQFKHNLIFSQ